MQSGFDPSLRHLGTPIEDDVKAAFDARVTRFKDGSDHAARVMAALWDKPTLSFNEREALFPKSPQELQGMTLTNPPTGGFGAAAGSVVVGAGPGGAEFSTRLNPTVFMQPGYPGKRKEVGPAGALAVNPDSPPWREYDGKTRTRHGSMTVHRVDQEHAAAVAAHAASMEAMDPPVGPEGVEGPEGPVLAPAPVFVAPAAPAYTPAAAVTDSLQLVLPPAPLLSFGQQLVAWAHAVGRSPGAILSPETWSANNQWEAVVIVLLATLCIVFFIGWIATSAKR